MIGIRENRRGREQILFKMSGRLPRLRALRPRPQHFKTEPHKESNLKENRRETVMKEHDLQSEDISYSVKDDDTIKKHEHEAFDYSESSQNYECKTCKPSKSLSSLKAYLDHLKKEHKQKVYYFNCNNYCYIEIKYNFFIKNLIDLLSKKIIFKNII